MDDQERAERCPECLCKLDIGADKNHESFCHAPCRTGAAQAMGQVVLLSSALDSLLTDQDVNTDGTYTHESARRAGALLKELRS